jgi:hypothetical protein
MKMKRKIGLIIAVVLTVALLTSTVAFAGNGNNLGNALAKAQDRLEFLNKIKPLVEQMSSNMTKVVSLRAELKNQNLAAKTHIAELKSNIGSLTAEQIKTLQSIISQIKTERAALKATNPQMVTAKQALRAARKAKSYDDYLAAYNTVVSLQQTRMDQLSKLIDLNKQIQAV